MTEKRGHGSARVGQEPRARLHVQRVRPAYRQVADELRTQVIVGTLSPGQRLPTEPKLCAMFGVSRSTVREALRVLASQHLIETVRGVQGGSFVATPDPLRMAADMASALGLMLTTPRLSVDNMLEARLLLEPPAARLVAERADDDTIEALRRAADPVANPRDPSNFAQHIDFHSTLLMATGNPLLPLMCQPISDVLLTRLDRGRVDGPFWHKIDDWHVRIVAAVAGRRPDEAEALTREHLERLKSVYEQIEVEPTDAQNSGHRASETGLL